MSSEDEGDSFVGEGGRLHDGHQEVADLSGQAAGTWEEDDDNIDEEQAREGVSSHDDASHTFTGHTGTHIRCCLLDALMFCRASLP